MLALFEVPAVWPSVSCGADGAVVTILDIQCISVVSPAPSARITPASRDVICPCWVVDLCREGVRSCRWIDRDILDILEMINVLGRCTVFLRNA